MLRDPEKLKGVNLGGWLVLEKWITPDLFSGTTAVDEFNLHSKFKNEKEDEVKNHYKTFITENDFKYLSSIGINAVRIPAGHYIFGDVSPFPKSIEYLDLAFDLAAKYNIWVLLDLHTAPGSQNGWDHSGVAGSINWHKKKENITQTLAVLSRLSNRYHTKENLFGIELLNEPHDSIRLPIIKDFYTKGYAAVREYCKPNVAVVISDSFRPLKWNNFMVSKEFENVLLDLHLYQCFSKEDKALTMPEHVDKTQTEWGRLVKRVQQKRQAICGEWSLGIDPMSLRGLTKIESQKAIQAYGKSQMEVFSDLTGWFFWNYKTKDLGGWNFKHSLEQGILEIL